MRRELSPGFDRVLLRAPVGVMFRDNFDQRVVAEGLHVELRDLLTGRRQGLAANAQGVFVAHSLPRWRMLGDDNHSSPPATRPFLLQLGDRLGRFLPMRLQADLPTDGLLAPDGPVASRPDAPPFVPLFSAPARTLTAGVGIVRACLRRSSDPERPVAWARVELWLGATRLGEGVTDPQGSLQLPCALPPPREPPLHGSPPAAAADFERERWDVTLRAHWDPALIGTAVPDLHALQRQPEVALLQSAGPPALPLRPQVLRAGEPLVARSGGSSFLFVGA
ncbi:hypothetical protein OOT46_29350 [Aquabacterium sp. A7-Y]|uniref:hypothetical protein n=1 Tax=Aquabacterium sp. A7-Y TaxID=1349605 RepID=UPI00223DAB7B|nr:hypothetical protein [Aquabacterium sp. A7-Y]MCW7541908.1 hypothetical protein [Aquabacterium sp. A7-Y]